ncbi:hypothetical protein AAFF_G00304350 [Aldrovandia affinis]|uniref:Uncharacterized protein n=1 Tax=Aldrovandia affinis TaxID=143900 RepID=A0AAD7SP79_9TELE|nr:hypothetical protein AAFF_G00304350 [Aldrovandia affinis]
MCLLTPWAVLRLGRSAHTGARPGATPQKRTAWTSAPVSCLSHGSLPWQAAVSNYSTLRAKNEELRNYNCDAAPFPRYPGQTGPGPEAAGCATDRRPAPLARSTTELLDFSRTQVHSCLKIGIF